MHIYPDEKRVVFMWDDIRRNCTTPEQIELISKLTSGGKDFMTFYDIIERLGYLAYIKGKSDAMYEMLDGRRSE